MSRVTVSVIVPVYCTADYLPACLDSLLDDGGDLAIEVIAVDDASLDSSGLILDDRAALDPRLRVVHLGGKHGRGLACQLGLSLASGDFVWFADVEDCAANGALPRIAAALAAGTLQPRDQVVASVGAVGTTGPSRRNQPIAPARPLTSFALLIAGSRRQYLGEAWRADLIGPDRQPVPSWRQLSHAAG